MKTIESQVIEIIAHAVMIPTTEVTPDAKLSALGVTSLDHVECVLAVEETFRIELDPSKLRKLSTVKDVIDVVNNALATA